MVAGHFAFIRRSEAFSENFSIGLRYDPKDGSGDITLIRCNGPHGGYNHSADPNHPHWDFHVHRASQEAIDAGLKPERKAEKSEAFASFEEALTYLLREINLEQADMEIHFPNISRQITFEWPMDVQ